MRPPANNALARLGTLSVTLNDELRPGWLVAHGTTEYARAAYPAFVTKFSAKAWFLAGTTAPTFKLLDLRDLELVIAGKGVTLGSVVGIAEYELGRIISPRTAIPTISRGSTCRRTST